MSQMRHQKNPGASKEWEGLLSEMEWVPLVLDWFFCCRELHRQQGVRRSGTRLALEFERAGSVSYTIGRIPGGPGDE